ncbi:hypothetical protein LX36DRAFT_445457 [Colletotrichum falcatum]|nr:hypothetical protein LX36DRAFT_445457 [Colletotrichum falcatum]
MHAKDSRLPPGHSGLCFCFFCPLSLLFSPLPPASPASPRYGPCPPGEFYPTCFFFVSKVSKRATQEIREEDAPVRWRWSRRCREGRMPERGQGSHPGRPHPSSRSRRRGRESGRVAGSRGWFWRAVRRGRWKKGMTGH